jgi:hypothetical protein
MLILQMLLLSFGLFSQPGNTASLQEVSNIPKHPFFVSVSQIQENTKEKILEITCKIFTDDFEKDLRKDLNTHVDLLSQADKPAMDKLVNNYVKKHFQITVDGKPCVLQFVGFEQDEEAVECFFQINDITVNKTVTVVNNILFDYKPEQVNIVHVVVRGTRKSTQLVNPDSVASFDFP